MDKEWLLNHKAIQAARECMGIVRDEMGIKLTLANPDLLPLLAEYSLALEIESLRKSFVHLMSMADEKLRAELLADPAFNASFDTPLAATPDSEDTGASAAEPVSDEQVAYAGKQYPRWQEGKEFKGFYRGQPAYR